MTRTDDVAGSLIDALADEGEHVDHGSFTLDRAAALTKLRDYQLADAHAYLLLLVEAAWVAGQGRDREPSIRIDCRSDTTVRFAGPSLAADQLRELFSAVFGGERGLDGEELVRARTLQLLGVAANNALALAPDRITIEACDANGGGLRLTISPTSELSLARTDAAEPGWIEFCFDGRGTGYTRGVAERDLVIERCRHASFPIVVDDVEVSRKRIQGLRDRVPVSVEDREIGVAGYRHHSAPARVEIVNRGVGVVIAIPEAQPGFMAVVEADLPMDLSRKQLLDGPELDRIRSAIDVARRTMPVPRYRPSDGPAPTTNPSLALFMVLGFLMFGVLIAVMIGSNQAPSSATTPEPAKPSVDPARDESLQRRCEAKDTAACAVWIPTLDPACEAGDAYGCYAAGVARLRGIAQPEQLYDAQLDFARGCRLGLEDACEAAQWAAERMAIPIVDRPPLGPDAPDFLPTSTP